MMLTIIRLVIAFVRKHFLGECDAVAVSPAEGACYLGDFRDQYFEFETSPFSLFVYTKHGIYISIA